MSARWFGKARVAGLLAAMIVALAAAPSASANHLMADPFILEYDYFWIIDNYQNFGTEPPNEPGVPGGPSLNDPSCPPNGMQNTSWWQVEGSGGDVTVTTAEDRTDTNIDTLMAVYVRDNSGNFLLVDCNNSPAPGIVGAEVSFASDAGREYFVQVGQLGGQGGVLEIVSIADDEPANDNRAQAETISAGPEVIRDNRGATLEAGEGSACGKSFNKTVWFRYTIPERGSARFDLSSPFFTNAVLILYPGGSGPPLCGSAISSFEYRAQTGVRDGGTFLVQVGAEIDGNNPETPGWDPDEGLFGIQVTFTRDLDDDDDGVPDAQDRCPRVRGTGGVRDCPDPDGDGWADGIDDRCNGLGGRDANRHQGCPDNDGDGIPEGPGGRDACPSTNPGQESRRDTRPNDGCPDTLLLHNRIELDRSVLLAPGGIILEFFRVKGVPQGATVRVVCRRPNGRRCGGVFVRRASAARVPATATRTIRVKNIPRRLRYGTKITTRVTAPFATGSLIRFRVARNAQGFKETFFCMNRGSKKPRPRRRGCR